MFWSSQYELEILNELYHQVRFRVTEFEIAQRGGGGDSLIKVGTDVRARALNFWQVLTKKCVIFDKRVKEVTYLLKVSNISNFGTLKLMKTCSVIRFLGTFLPGH